MKDDPYVDMIDEQWDNIELTSTEKQKVAPDDLFVLALRGVAKLTTEDKQRLPPDDLFMLALRGVAHLTPPGHSKT